jgi:DNA-directed RNA polymerase subunit RPC12/RpoP
MLSAILLCIRHGAVLATLAAVPPLVGIGLNAVWRAPSQVTIGTYGALAVAWLASMGVVAGLTFHTPDTRGTGAARWFYKCKTCGNRVAIFSYRCIHCRTPFHAPPEANAFRSALLYGVGVFYGFFAVGTYLLRF